jgi:para-nitrobenzyl esterase
MPYYHGEGLAHHGDVVVVTINHRLNAFGFTYLADILGDEFADSGNVGILDGSRALEWVRDNIEGFGGDPNNVTIFGESGGGAKVSTLMAMPAAHGLFHKAVVESGAGLSMTPADKATENAEKLLKAAGIDKANARKLQEISQDELTAACLASHGNFGPVVDGGALPRDPFSPDATPLSADIPLIVGTNRHEASFFFRNGGLNPDMTEAEMKKQLAGPKGDNVDARIAALKKENPKATPWELFLIGASWDFMVTKSILMAERKSEQKAPVYMYRFDHEVPWKDGAVHAMHTAEIPFVFNNLKKNAWLVGDDAPQSLADDMSGAWAAFAHTGNPNVKGLPKWPTYDAKTRATMIFNVKSKVVDDPNPAERKAFMGLA